jgi:hypothetical protein
MEEINHQLDLQLSTLDKINGADKYAAYDESVRMISAAIENEKKALDDYTAEFLGGPEGSTFSIDLASFNGDLEAARAKVQEYFAVGLIDEGDRNNMIAYFDDIAAKEQQINDLERERLEMLTQTTASDLSNELADSITAAMEAGTDATLAWGQVLDDVFRKAILNSLKLKYLQPATEKFVSEMGKAMEDGLISPEEQEFLQRIIDESATLYEREAAMVNQMLPGSGSGSASTSQAAKTNFSTMKEETGSALLGQFTALRMSSAIVADIAKDEQAVRRSLFQALVQIADNTSYCRKLENMDKTLTELLTDGIKVR